MGVEFMIRRDDLTNFLEKARKDKVPEGKEWIASLTVKGSRAVFAAGETSSEYAVYTTEEGKVKMPISCLEEVVGWGFFTHHAKSDRMGEREWAGMKCIDGRVSYGTHAYDNDHISLACCTNFFELYSTKLELLVLGRLLPPETVALIGLESRITDVRSEMEREIRSVAHSLERYGVSEEDIREVVEKSLKRTEPIVRESDIYRWSLRPGIKQKV